MPRRTAPQDGAKRKTSGDGSKTGHGFGGGKRRDVWTVEDITQQVLQMVASGVGRPTMARQIGKWMFEKGLAETDAPMVPQTLTDYIARAKALAKEGRAKSRDEALDMAKVRVKRLANAALGDKKYSAAVQAENLLADLEGVKSAQRVELAGPDGGPVAVKTVLTSDERRARAAALAEAARQRAGGGAGGV